ncbi:uncharacterized protein LOC106664842 [Cimex lectularius]|uniref:Uncharacterized protein n=1 Tax=Cimex lectularius TaxID=79782 RepID=A0A8I6RJM6_CIMLE|nr:uncharacterized protein LOC106664842 [Cimex lectularius]
MKSRIFTLALFLHMASRSIASFAGPYDVVPLELGKCASSECESPKIIFSNYKIRKLDRSSYVYSGVLNCTIPVNDEVKLTTDVSIWGNGGWKPNFYYLEVGGLCSGMEKYLPQFKKEIFAQVNQSCPAVEGIYNFENVSFVQESQLMNAIPYGKYKTVIKGVDSDGNCLLCAIFACDIIPKAKKKS